MDIEKLERRLNGYQKSLGSLFEVKSIIEKTVVLTDLDTNHTYYVNGLPCNLLVQGMIMSGGIGKRKGDIAWEWYRIESVYPQRGKRYMLVEDGQEVHS